MFECSPSFSFLELQQRSEHLFLLSITICIRMDVRCSDVIGDGIRRLLNRGKAFFWSSLAVPDFQSCSLIFVSGGYCDLATILYIFFTAASKMVATASSTSNNYSFAELEFSVNENNGVYQHDKAYDTQKRL